MCMKRSFSKVLRTLVVAAGLSLTLVSGMSYAERAAMAPLPSPSGVDIPPKSVPANPNSLANGTQAQSQPAQILILIPFQRTLKILSSLISHSKMFPCKPLTIKINGMPAFNHRLPKVWCNGNQHGQVFLKES